VTLEGEIDEESSIEINEGRKGGVMQRMMR
jgi:hypothetical protein